MDPNNIVKKYTNGEITIVWESGKCTHSAKCFNGLPQVFDPRKRPWIEPEGATTSIIAAQIDRCPSGALTYYYNKDKE